MLLTLKLIGLIRRTAVREPACTVVWQGEWATTPPMPMLATSTSWLPLP